MITNNTTVIDILNGLLRIDPEAITELFSYRVPCTRELADHPTIQVGVADNETGFDVSMIGILNSIVPDTGVIVMEYQRNPAKVIRFFWVTNEEIPKLFAQNRTEHKLQLSLGGMPMKNNDKWVKNPVVVNAIQWKEVWWADSISKYPDLFPEWLVEAYELKRFWQDDETGNLMIKTEEGVMRFQKGDWIIKGIEGEIYPCKNSIFQKSYTLANPQT